ncbi:MAG: ABC transporter permease [Deltaproteobacteria bacterium]|nr:MAG: ABC transporter permease [Deltaproteobacteria bacterium]
MRVDLGAVDAIDDVGVALVGAVADEARRRRVDFGVTRFSAPAEAAFRQAAGPATARAQRGLPAKGFEGLGESVVGAWQSFVAFVVLTSDTFGFLFGGARRTRRVRRGATAFEAVRFGVDALPIVALISFLVGLVVALQAAYQLARFGANIYVADLIAVSMTREMGPLMTAIIIAGRSGAAIAAEIATMQVSEEIDALYVMGLEPTRYIVVPKFLGMTVTMPLLVAFANFFGVIGGFLVSILYLGVGPGAFWSQVGDALFLKDVATGLTKSVAFAWIIVLIAAHRGFSARGGAESVGRVTTASVVSSIFWVIVADAVFSILFYFG